MINFFRSSEMNFFKTAGDFGHGLFIGGRTVLQLETVSLILLILLVKLPNIPDNVSNKALHRVALSAVPISQFLRSSRVSSGMG